MARAEFIAKVAAHIFLPIASGRGLLFFVSNPQKLIVSETPPAIMNSLLQWSLSGASKNIQKGVVDAFCYEPLCILFESLVRPKDNFSRIRKSESGSFTASKQRLGHFTTLMSQQNQSLFS